MAGRGIITAVLLAAVGVAALGVSRVEAQAGEPVAGEAPWVSPRQVDEALAKASGYLLSKRHPQFMWEVGARKPMPAFAEVDVEASQYGGRTAMAVLALLSAGARPQDKEISEAVEFLLQNPTEGTYALGFRCQLWAALPQRAEIRAMARRERDLLLAGMHRDGPRKGYFTYGVGRRASPNAADRSCSQYAVLAAWACEQMGLVSPRDFWTTVDTVWRRDQATNGGWGYPADGHATSDDHCTMGMTTAGVATLFISNEFVQAGRGLECRGNIIDENIDRGLAWVVERYADILGKGDLYSLYGIERIGVASGLKYFKSMDWFERGAASLLKAQAADGSFRANYTGEHPISNTAFAMLFLARGRAPVMFNKLQYNLPEGDEVRAGPWIQRPRDVANIVRWTGRQTERTLNWQIVPLDGSERDLLDAPVLVVSGNAALRFNDEQSRRIVRYLEDGGLLLANADCGSQAFSRSVVELGERLFPGRRFRELPGDHPVYRQQFRRSNWRGPPKVVGLSNGIRELILLVEEGDPARAWQMQRYEGSEPAFQFGANVFQYSVERQNLRYKGQHHLEPLRPGARSSNRIALARLRHAGAWDPEPGGWRRMVPYLLNRGRADLKVSAVEIDDGLIASRYAVAHLTGLGELKLDDGQVDALREYLREGGNLIVDAAGGDRAFAESFRAILPRVVPGGRLEVLPDDFVGYLAWDNTSTIRWREYARSARGAFRSPQIEAAAVGSRLAVFFSPDDLSNGLVGQPVDGVMGYSTESATSLMQNLVLYAAADPKPAPPPPPALDEQLRKPFAEFAPDWSLRDCGDARPSGLRPEHNGRKNVFVTQPRSVALPAVLSRELPVPAAGKTVLRFEAGRHPDGDWMLFVRVNDDAVVRRRIDAATAPGGWHTVEVDLADYAGKIVTLELQNRMGNSERPMAVWSDLVIVSD